MKEESQLNIKLPDKAFLRPDEVAKILDLSISTIYNMIDEGELPAKKIRRRWRIPTNNLYEFLKRSNHNSSLLPSI